MMSGRQRSGFSGEPVEQDLDLGGDPVTESTFDWVGSGATTAASGASGTTPAAGALFEDLF